VTDAGKVATAVSSGDLDLQTEEGASDHGLLASGMVLSPQGTDKEAACHAMSAGAVLQVLSSIHSLFPCDTYAGSALGLQFAGKGVKRYLADCEACLRIQVQSDTIDGTTEFLRVGKLRVFRRSHHLKLPSDTV
jgi:hypothetical protein